MKQTRIPIIVKDVGDRCGTSRSLDAGIGLVGAGSFQKTSHKVVMGRWRVRRNW